MIMVKKQKKNSLLVKGNISTSFILIATIALIIGYILGSFLPFRATYDKEQIIQETKQEIKGRLIKGMIIGPIPEEIFSLWGNVTEKGEDYLMVEPSIRQDPLGDLLPLQMKILVNDNTEIVKIELKDQEVFAKELQEYQTLKNKDDVEWPNQYIETLSNFDDINIDYYILSAETENNIKGKSEFLAKTIRFSLDQQ